MAIIGQVTFRRVRANQSVIINEVVVVIFEWRQWSEYLYRLQDTQLTRTNGVISH